jgi:hypothetical protein
MIASLVTRASAAVLLLGGLALLFASDVILPGLVPGFPPAAAWLGQVLGAAWLGLAALNWSHRAAVLGGIFGRPVVFANLVTYVVGALALLKPLQGPATSPAAWFLAAPMVALAIAYGALLFRGPFGSLQGG